MGGGESRPATSNGRRLPPFTNIPTMEAGGSLVSQAIHATVQGINDSSNPPASFNTSGNVRSCKSDADGASPDDDAARRPDHGPAAFEEIYSSDKSDDSIAVYNDWNAHKIDGVLDSTDKFHCASRSPCPSGLDAKASEAPQYKFKEWTYLDGPASNRAWGIPRWAGLRGGGEMSLNNGTTSWGTPPSGNSNANNSNNNTGNNPGGQAQWGGPAPNNNNRPNAGASQGSSAQPNAGCNNPANKGANPQAGSGVGSGAGAGGPPGGVGAPQAQQAQQQGPGPGPGQAAGPAGQAQPNQPPPSTSQPPPPAHNGSNSWAQAAGGSQAASSNAGAPPAGNASPAMPSSSAAAGSTPSTKQQLEQLNTMREALFSQDGWGGVSRVLTLARY